MNVRRGGLGRGLGALIPTAPEDAELTGARLEELASTMTPPAGSSDATVLAAAGGIGDLAKPTLGRYEVIRELGKGAMGVVFLGKDPKINREVAIKTLRFEDEFDPADMSAMKERMRASRCGPCASPAQLLLSTRWFGSLSSPPTR